ncbi:MAG: hypothetical protein ACI9VR_000077 [Cognaticolwellia sp.]|jgi:hypothetical protein
MPVSLHIPSLFFLSALSLSASALGAPVLCAAGLGWTLLSAIGAARPLRLYQLLLFVGIALATGASWTWCLLLSAPVTVAAIACTVASPRYRGPGVALLVEKLQNKRTSPTVVCPWTMPQKSPPAVLVLGPVLASSRVCEGTPVVG